MTIENLSFNWADELSIGIVEYVYPSVHFITLQGICAIFLFCNKVQSEHRKSSFVTLLAACFQGQKYITRQWKSKDDSIQGRSRCSCCIYCSFFKNTLLPNWQQLPQLKRPFITLRKNNLGANRCDPKQLDHGKFHHWSCLILVSLYNDTVCLSKLALT